MSEKKSPLGEFKDFVMQGNVVDLAVAVVIATFFGVVIKDVVNLILSLLAIPGKGAKSFSDLYFKIGHAKFLYGALIHLFMTFITIPLSRAPKRKFSASSFLSQLAVHMFIVGLSISLTIARLS